MKIAEVIRENKARILKGWMEKVLKEIPEAAGYDKLAIENSVPDLIDEIVSALEKHPTRYITHYAKLHATGRSQLKIYSLERVIREYNLLRIEIFNIIDEYEDIDPVERDTIMLTFDSVIEQSAETYFRIREAVNINARKIAEKKADELELQDENREDFIRSITHDLNTPLNNIKGCINLLEGDLEIDQAHKILLILKGSAHQAELIIKDFLDVTTITSTTKLPVYKVKINILDVLRRQIIFFKTAHQRNIELKSSRDEIIAEFDNDLLTRAFNNLLGNAIRHGDKSSTITVSCNIENKYLTLAVNNLGKQIPIDILDSIFGRFYKIDKVGSGWGIGLAFVKEVAIAHGGEVSAKSNPRDGNTFTLKIPLSSGTSGVEELLANGP